MEVAYARPERQVVIAVDLPEGSSVIDAIQASAMTVHFPELASGQHAVGVFGKVVNEPARRVLKDGERIEIYRPLLIDPKTQRLARARKT
ncbi:RnfH family protein [Allohahella marinimesophila]|uniref:RnfH family protein n=1 Tax=Allohahella marinimesophila TaxID=1054972 RepID=UPI0031CE6AD4